MSLILEIIYQ